MLNYKQLHHFWNVARAGGIVRASERSGLAPQTLSGQIATLEASLGVTLFRRQGRGLVLTETGEMVLAYAEEIFRVGSELEAALRNRSAGRTIPYRVGIADAVPKSVAQRLLAPCLQLPGPVRIICRENKLDRLLGELAIHKLDVVLADSPIPPQMDVRGYCHTLLESPVALFAAPALADTLSGEFPACLDNQPMLLPGTDSASRGPLRRWLEEQHISPRIVGEFDDSALMASFGGAGTGIFPAPLLIAGELCNQYQVRQIGVTSLTNVYYAISVERRLTHPATLAISKAYSPDKYAVPSHP